MIKWIRKNIGFIISSLGLILLIIVTYGDIGELFTEQYWINVGGNLTSISALTVGLMFILIMIKQGVSEQALSKGLNTPDTTKKYDEHKNIVKRCQAKQIYLPYFLTIYNERETKRRKQEFIIGNNFFTEKELYASKNKKLIKLYESIRTNITVDSIKWSTTEIVYDKNGSIEKLDKFRRHRLIKAIISGFIAMFATTLIAGGLFVSVNEIPFWQKTVKLLTYLLVIGINTIFDITLNFEKGAFGVPNELEEVNSIWEVFEKWETPDWVIKEVEQSNLQKVENIKTEKQQKKEENKNGTILPTFEEKEETTYARTTLQEKPEKIEII